TEMLVLDGIELAAINHLFDIRNFYDDHAIVFQQTRKAAHDAVEISDVSQYVVGMNNVCANTCGRKFFGQSIAEEIADGRNRTFALGNARDVGCRLYAQNRNARALVVLQQIAVVACDLYNQTLPVKPKRLY